MPSRSESDPALRALLHDFTCRENSPHMYLTKDGYSRPRCELATEEVADLAAAEAAPLDVTDTECVDAYDQGRADALRELARDIESLRNSEPRSWIRDRALDQALAVLAALRSPDTETAE